MTKNIEPNLKLISEYLTLKKDENFVIPEYQRSYSWGIDQCDKLWQDIELFIDSNASDPYFFGTIIIDCSDRNKFNLIDGQQRTTTFLLLFKALYLALNDAILKVPDDEESEPLKEGLKDSRKRIMEILYKAEAEEIPSMLKDIKKTQGIIILENKSINALYPDEVKIIIEAVDFSTTEENVAKIPRKQKDNKYTNHFRNFKFFFYKLKNKSETQLNQFSKKLLKQCQIIEIRSWQIEQAITMFNSLNSTGLSLSDADIISAQLYSKAGDDKSEFNNKWEKINKLTNELNNQKIIDIDSVLQEFMYINRALDKEYLKIQEDGKESIDVTTPGLRRYYTDIKKDLLNNPLKLCNRFEEITEKWDKIKSFPTIKLLLKFNENAKLFLASYLFRYEQEYINEKDILIVTESLLRLFTILELTDVGYSSSKFKTFLFKENIKLVNKNISNDEIKRDFDNHIQNNWKENEIKELIDSYEKNILVFLNEYLYQKDNFYFDDNVNIEHIMPSSGKNISIIRQDADIEELDEFLSLVNKIGNKILLEENINKSIGNEWFKTKKQTSIKDKSGYKDSVYAIASSLTNFKKDEWKKEDIKKATKKVSERIVKFVFDFTNH